jgi:hypothetical protein
MNESFRKVIFNRPGVEQPPASASPVMLELEPIRTAFIAYWKAVRVYGLVEQAKAVAQKELTFA